MMTTYEQLDLFSFLDKEPTFDPILEYAKYGSGFQNGKNRIKGYFANEKSKTKRAKFLKEEYGCGGFGRPCNEPFVIMSGDSDSKGLRTEYYNEEMKRIKVSFSYNELEKAIDQLICNGKY